MTCSKSLTAMIGLLVGCLFTLAPVAAAEPSEALTLADAIEDALRHNPEIAASRHHLAAAGFQAVQARSGLLPHLDASKTYSRTDSPLWAFGTRLNQEAIRAQDFAPERLNDPDAIDNYNSALSLNWNLFDGGRTLIGWQQARKAEEAAALELLRSEQQIIAHTAAAYWGLLLAAQNRDVVVQSLDTARAHLKVVEDRFRGGMVVKSDLLRAQVRIADLEQQSLQAESQVQVAEAMLKAVMGRADERPLDLVSRPEAAAPLDALPSWIERALQKRPELQRMQIQEAIARKAVERARAGHWPTLALTGKYEFNSEDFLGDAGENYMLAATANLNLYSGQRISSEAAAAKSMLAGVQSRYRGVALDVRVQVQRAYYNAQSAWKSIAVAAAAVEQAEEGLRIVANRYQGGLLTILSLLDAQVAFQQARTQHFKALHDYQVARIEMMLAAGVIDKHLEQ
jgi:outer membrane protein